MRGGFSALDGVDFSDLLRMEFRFQLTEGAASAGQFVLGVPRTVALVPQGGACTEASQCATPFCANGVCCDSACDQPLQQCNLPGQAGTCATNAVAPATSRGGFVVMLAALLLTGFVALRARLRA